MYISLYRKSDLLLLMQIGNAEDLVKQQIRQLIQALVQIQDERKVVRISDGYLTYSVSVDNIIVISDVKPHEQMIEKVESFVTVNIGTRIGGASRELQLSGYSDQLSEEVSKWESQSQLELLQAEVAGAHRAVAENLESIVKRGARLSQLEDASVEILQDTRALMKASKELDLKAFWRKNATYLAAGAVAVILLYILFR